MPRFAANISLMYPEYGLPDRIDAAARDGFAAIEIQTPYAVDATEFRRAIDACRVQLVLINAPVGDFAGGERGLAALPGHEREFGASIERALDYARTTGAPRVHVMAGTPGDVPHAEALAVYERNIASACRTLALHGIAVTIEPINANDFPGYFLDQLPLAVSVIERVAPPKPGLQFDFYHLQIIHGDLIRHLRRHFTLVGHVQIADVPGRNEPGTGEVNFSTIFRELDQLGYPGWAGCEYRPADAGPGGTSAGLSWLRRI